MKKMKVWSGPPKRHNARRNKTTLNPRGLAEISLKIEDLRSNKTTNGLPGCNVNVSDDQQPEFRSLSEFYINIFLNKLKIVENTPKNQNKTPMVKAIGPFRDLQAPSWLTGTLVYVPTETSLS